jgi:hypothetical protein
MIGAGEENLSPTEKDESPEYNFNRPPVKTFKAIQATIHRVARIARMPVVLTPMTPEGSRA